MIGRAALAVIGICAGLGDKSISLGKHFDGDTCKPALVWADNKRFARFMDLVDIKNQTCAEYAGGIHALVKNGDHYCWQNICCPNKNIILLNRIARNRNPPSGESFCSWKHYAPSLTFGRRDVGVKFSKIVKVITPKSLPVQYDFRPHFEVDSRGLSNIFYRNDYVRPKRLTVGAGSERSNQFNISSYPRPYVNGGRFCGDSIRFFGLIDGFSCCISSSNRSFSGQFGLVKSSSEKNNAVVSKDDGERSESRRYKEHQFGPSGGLPLGLKIAGVMALFCLGFYNAFRAVDRFIDTGAEGAFAAQVAIGVFLNLLGLALLVSIMEPF
jgi:hypothetical protein